MSRPRQGLVTALLLLTLLPVLLHTARAQFFPEDELTNDRIVFGCDPGPIEEFVHADPPVPPPPIPDRRQTPRPARLTVYGDRPGRVVDGNGFNLEHTLWSCPSFRRMLNRWVLQPFQPEIARVDAGQLPLAPEWIPAEDLHWGHYQEMMDDRKYQPSWDMLRRLDQAGVRLMLGVWGAPGAFNDDGTRRGRLLPEYADGYVDYYTAVVDYLVRRKGIRIWSATVMNEPDGGDGTLIDPDDFVSLARKLGPALAAYDVALYGPDTASAENAIPYVQRLLREPAVLGYFAAIGTHEYFTEHELRLLVETVRGADWTLPIYVTEYTSFRFGALDRGQEASDEVGQMLDSLRVYASLMNTGADAALYWDAVDYYQAGHAAITRWGLLRGPQDAFEPRKRYYGFLQLLPYVQRGTQVLESSFDGSREADALAVTGGSNLGGDVLMAVINGGVPLDLTIDYRGRAPSQLEVYVTDLGQNYEHVGRASVRGGRTTVYIPGRSVTTLLGTSAP